MDDDARAKHARWVGTALDRYGGALTQYAERLTGDAHRARDVVQEAFLRLCREDDARLDGRLRPWLYRVARNLAIDHRRREKHMERTNAAGVDDVAEERGSPRPGPEAAAEAREDAAKAIAALDDLPEAQQECVRLKFRHGLSYREIAEVTGLTVGYVGVLIHEGVKALRKRLSGPAAATVGNDGGVR